MNPTDTDITPWPSSASEAAHILIKQLPIEDRIAIANMEMKEVAFLNLSLGAYIKSTYHTFNFGSSNHLNCSQMEG